MNGIGVSGRAAEEGRAAAPEDNVKGRLGQDGGSGGGGGKGGGGASNGGDGGSNGRGGGSVKGGSKSGWGSIRRGGGSNGAGGGSNGDGGGSNGAGGGSNGAGGGSNGRSGMKRSSSENATNATREPDTVDADQLVSKPWKQRFSFRQPRKHHGADIQVGSPSRLVLRPSNRDIFFPGSMLNIHIYNKTTVLLQLTKIR